ncbi:MAG: rod shape-determining protein MreC [Balneolales bacterium]|nr:rod shape-determining protein MreC [Balneolales bacterium]
MRITFTKLGDIKDQLLTVGFLIIALIMMSARQDGAFQNVRKASITLISLVETPLSNVRVYRSALRTNAALEQNTIRLQDEVSRLRSLREENNALRELLNLKESSDYTLHPVRVVTKNITGINNNLAVNAGSRHGVAIGMPVVNHEGLIGSVVTPGNSYSQVLPLFNRQFRASVRIEGSRALGILSWEADHPGELTVRFVPQTIGVEPGMMVSTSGMSNQFPAGIPIGEIIRSEPETGRETQIIYVRPFVNFSTLAEAHVMLWQVETEIKELELEMESLFR